MAFKMTVLAITNIALAMLLSCGGGDSNGVPDDSIDGFLGDVSIDSTTANDLFTNDNQADFVQFDSASKDSFGEDTTTQEDSSEPPDIPDDIEPQDVPDQSSAIDGDINFDGQVNPDLVDISATDLLDSADSGCTPPMSTLYYFDGDGDGWGNALMPTMCLAVPDVASGYTAVKGGDCDDTDPKVNAGASETCLTPYDDDCDGKANKQDAEGCIQFFIDLDKDGQGASSSECWCGPTSPYTANSSGDCDDSNALVNSEHWEDCATDYDDDCNGKTNEQDVVNCLDYYFDEDEDGYGVSNSQCWCQPHGLFSTVLSGDCNDEEALINPIGHVCNIDGDCDGTFLDIDEPCDDGNTDSWDGCKECEIVEFQVNSITQGDQWSISRSKVAAIEDGTFLVVWETPGTIFMRRFTADGLPSGIENDISTTADTQSSGGSSISCNTQGCVVAWTTHEKYGDQNPLVRLGFFDTLGNNKKLLDVFTAGYKQSPSSTSVSIGAQDRTLTVWTVQIVSGDDYDVYGRFTDTAGNVEGEPFVANDYTTGRQWVPHALFLDGGRAVVTWSSQTQDPDGSTGVFARMFDKDGKPEGSSFPLHTTNVLAQQLSDVAELQDGRLVFAWGSEVSDGDNDIIARLFDATGSPLGNEFTVNDSIGTSQGGPSLAVLSDGGIVVAWTSYDQDGDEAGIYAKLFDSDGNAVGQEYQVNTFWEGYQDWAGLASFKQGHFIIVWNSRPLNDAPSQDGDSSGLFALRFSNNGSKIYH